MGDIKLCAGEAKSTELADCYHSKSAGILLPSHEQVINRLRRQEMLGVQLVQH